MQTLGDFASLTAFLRPLLPTMPSTLEEPIDKYLKT